MRFENKNVLITGGAAGLGRVIATSFAREGANVFVLDRQPADGTLDEIAALGRQGRYRLCDVRDQEAVNTGVTAAATFFGGRIDVLINNAGFNGHYELVRDIDLAHWQETLDINLTGTMLVTRAVLPHMMALRAGAIGTTASNVSRRGLARRADYVCAKWAILGLNQTVALEVAQYNIRVNAVCPGPIEGDRIEDVMRRTASAENRNIDDIRREWEEAAPMKRFVTSDEVTAALMFLCSEDASGMTGQALNVTGGFLMT
jgi:NAD(P)-dependent dehydrogenase (short-subunit alcohol dehydrogenase family)